MDGETRCGGECVNINSDPRHCGGCQKACGDGEICTDSNCGKAPDCREIPCTGFTYCDLGTGKCKPGCDADDQCGPRQSCDVTTHSCVDAAVNNLLLVVDKSGSMMDASQEGGSQSKLEDARQALHLMLDEGEGKIRFGWMQFPHGSFCEPGVVSVDCGDDSVPEIRDRVNALLAEGGTPTGESLQKADTYRGLHDPHRCNFVLLLTDGLPTCPNGEGVGNNQADNQMALEAVQALHSQRIDTFVIGLGEDLNASNPEILNQMADAGGRARGGDVKYYQANNLDELQTTVQTIAVAVIGCNMR
jgi:Mg-chelatase subunit ChlD